MVSVASLLNPLPSDSRLFPHLPLTRSSKVSPEYETPNPPPTKKQKMCKDAAIFAKGKIKGEILYPPYEVDDKEVEEQHRKHQVFPRGHIADYCRHIPYNSEKKSFLEKTGRESFEVFQYTFKVPGDEREYTVMWDYNTTPAKMLNSNPGLRDICHSITGGALAAQGYWMPYEAAKAVAATFCYNIRYTLTPLFGPSFISLCIPPDDPRFGRMIIDRDIVRQCTTAAHELRSLGGERGVTPAHKSTATSHDGATPVSQLGCMGWRPKMLRPQPMKAAPPDAESGYGTDTDQSDRYMCSPRTPPESEWTAELTPRSAAAIVAEDAPKLRFSPVRWLAAKKVASPVDRQPNNKVKRSISDCDDGSDEAGDTSSALSSEDMILESENEKKKKTSLTPSREARAAYMLMQLHVTDAALAHRDKRRRASS
ncbi:MAG: hypothetical protein M1827_005665 [Pycnora praestabilis]|nr:MAG: hypothetical protein M1827_005665 [Pycnora praestabilis]